MWCEAIEHCAFLVREANQNEDQQMDDSNLFGQDMASRLHISTTNTRSRGRTIVSLFDLHFFYYNFVKLFLQKS